MSNQPKLTKLENRKEYKQFNQFLDAANNRTKENDNKRKTCQKYLNLFIDGLMKKLRASTSSKLLDKMYTRQIVSGNYFDCPTDLEYDENNLNILLKVPFGNAAETITIEKCSNTNRGYCRLRINGLALKQHENDPLVQEFRDTFVHKDNFLRVNALVTWYERIFNDYFTQNGGNETKYTLEIVQKNQTETLLFEISKPVKSVTGIFIKVYVPGNDIRFSIDISLGMEFDPNCSQYRAKIPNSIVSEKWVAIAKPTKTTVKDDLDWMCSFYSIERKILQEKGKVVPLIRIFKQFFNAAVTPNLHIYLIENLFFGEIVKQENANQTDFWKSSLASLFLHMIAIILEALKSKSIPYFWDNAVNLAQNINHNRIHDKLVQHLILLENEIKTADSTANFDDLFFKVGNDSSSSSSSSNNSSQCDETSNGPNSSILSLTNVFSYFGFYKKAECKSVENVSRATSSTPKHNDVMTNENSHKRPLTPVIHRDTPSSSQCRISIISTASSKTTFVDASNRTNEYSNIEPVTPVNLRPPVLSTSSSTTSLFDTSNRKTNKSVNATLILQLLSKFIKIKERQEYTDHYNAVLNFFISELKQDGIFAKIYKGHVMGGSYTDDLKVSKPNEFDTLLRFSFGGSKVRVEKCKIKPGYCNINLKECDLNSKEYLNKFLDENGYVLQDEILKWMQRLFTFILQKPACNTKIIRINNNSYKYAHSRNGPAFTFEIKVLDTDIEFDMDLVPSFPFDENNWLATREYPKDKNKIKWVAVPKPPKEGISNKNRSFICSYTELEKTYLHDANNAKNLIRLFKKLRDNNNLTSLKSYFIKTIFLWQFHDTTVAERNAFWKQPLDVVFLKMFKIILDHIERCELYFFWDTTYNMFSTIQPTVLKSMKERLRGIYSKIELNLKDNRNPHYLITIFLTKEEKAVFLTEHEEKLSRD